MDEDHPDDRRDDPGRRRSGKRRRRLDYGKVVLALPGLLAVVQTAHELWQWSRGV